jgi:dTDP-4-amino-4,6-dideoxygalactose transaminase
MTWRVPLVEIEVTDGDVEAVLDCLRSGWLTMGPRTQAFEEALAEMVGAKHAIVCANGTAALHLACHAVGLGPGDEAIVPALTFVASANAPRYSGAEVVFCDSSSLLDPGIDVAAVERQIGPRTKAVIAVHMWGYPADVEALRRLCDERGIALIEDCCEAIGARTDAGSQVGSVGDLGCFSLFSKKQLAVGEGGFVTTDDDELAAKVRSLRSHAMTSVTWERHRGHGLGYDVTDIGFNYRMDEPRAALGLSRLGRLEADIAARRKVAQAYRAGLRGLDGIELPYSEESVELASHFAIPVLAPSEEARDALRAELQVRGVQTTWYPAVHTLSEYESAARGSDLKVAGEIGARQLVLPVHASLSDEQVGFVVEQLASALEQVGAGA